MIRRHSFVPFIGALALVTLAMTTTSAQVGKGLLDPNVAAEKELAGLPHMTPGDRESHARKAALHERHRAQRLPARPEADAGSRPRTSTARRSFT